jgi:hypothetical protein
LSIAEGDDGRTLVHCFAGCSVYDVVDAVGLEVHDLFPPRPTQHRQAGERRPFPALDVLRAVESEATLVAVAAMSVANGQVLTEEELDRLVIAARRISDATEIANGTR